MNPVAVYDFTISKVKSTREDIQKWLSDNCSKWCFQLERGEGGFEHYQGRMSLNTKCRLGTLVKRFIPSGHLSPTSENNMGNMFYVSKEDSRVEGPWRDDDEKPEYIPRQLREIVEWRDWQKEVMEISEGYNPRKIHLIYDPIGNNGKSVLGLWFIAHKKGCVIPFANDYKDIMRMVMDMPKRGNYIIDMPRAINKEKLFQLYSAIETIKSGFAFDDRYHYKEAIFDCPNIFIFTNVLPDLNLLSRDRWELRTIRDHKLEAVLPGADAVIL